MRRCARPATLWSGSARRRRLAGCWRARPAGSRTPKAPSSARSAGLRSSRCRHCARGAEGRHRRLRRPRRLDGSRRAARPRGRARDSRARTTTRLRHELERHGGTVEKFIGDAVVGVFGAPVAHEDDPERAVRAALAIQEAIAELNEADPALQLEVRIGVNTGEALVALGARPERGRGDGRRRRR